jgi:hypothetical protein
MLVCVHGGRGTLSSFNQVARGAPMVILGSRNVITIAHSSERDIDRHPAEVFAPPSGVRPSAWHRQDLFPRCFDGVAPVYGDPP